MGGDNRMDNKTNRCDYIDILRCFSIVVMIMGHVYFGNVFNKIIHSFHMPIWFVISGYFFNSDKDYKGLINRSPNSQGLSWNVPSFDAARLYSFRDRKDNQHQDTYQG